MNVLLCSLFILFSSNLFAGSPQRNQAKSWIQETLLPALPYQWKTAYNYLVDESRMVLIKFTSNDRDKCMKFRKDFQRGASSRAIEDSYRVFINKNCLNDNVFTPGFKEENLKITGEMVSAIVKDIWSKNRRLLKKHSFYDKDNQREIYANDYFHIPIENKEMLYQKFNGVLRDFYTIGFMKYLTNPKLSSQNARLYQFLKFNLMDGRTFHHEDPNVAELAEKDYENKAQMQLITENNESFWMRYNLIKNAKESILLQTFHWERDHITDTLLSLLFEKQAEGVKIYFMVDGKASVKAAKSDGAFRELRRRGAKVKLYNPLWLNITNFFKFLEIGFIDSFVASNHDKILLVDDIHLITGGRNHVDMHFLSPEEYDLTGITPFNDMDIYLKFEKPAINAMKAFTTEFYDIHSRSLWKTGKSKPEVVEKLARTQKAMEERMTSESLSAETLSHYPEFENFKSLYGLQSFQPKFANETVNVKGMDKTSRLGKFNNITNNLISYIDAEPKGSSIHIQNPYVVPPGKIQQAIERASERGVNVTIILPGPTSGDSGLINSMVLKRYGDRYNNMENVRVLAFEQEHEYLHAKVYVFGDHTTFLGSYNLDNLSQKHNSEYMVAIKSKTLTEMTLNDLQFDIDNKAIPFQNLSTGEILEHTRKKAKKASRVYWLAKIIHRWI